MSAPAGAERATSLANRAPWVAAAIALVAGLLTMTSDPIGVFYDDAVYLLTAKALAEGHGYVYASLPGSPPAIHYPPLWPAILAVAWKIGPAFPANVGWLKLINPAFIAVAAGCTVLAGRRVFGLPWWLALGVAILSFVSVPVLVLTNVLLSEPLFLALLFPTLFVTERFMREGGVRWAAMAAAMAALIVLGRTIAGVVVIATVLVLLLDRRWRDVAIYVAVTVLLLLPWQFVVWDAAGSFPDELRGSYGPYLEWVADGYKTGGLPFLGEVLRANIIDAWTMVGIFVSPLVRGPVRALLAVSALALLLAGLIHLWRRGSRVTSLAIAGYIAVVLGWPFQVERFVWALWPLLVLLIAFASVDLMRGLRASQRPRLALTVLTIALLVGAGNITYNARGLSRGWAQSASGEMAERATNLIRYVNADARMNGLVIASEVAPMVALYTGQLVVPVEILTTREHIEPKTHADLVDAIERIDRRFSPGAYVVLSGGLHVTALLDAKLDTNRTLREVTPAGVPVRAFLATNAP